MAKARLGVSSAADSTGYAEAALAVHFNFANFVHARRRMGGGGLRQFSG
eukprot:CAMPEP_0194340876 /NCGR_PEP_ID=MMETSP0171-20130528/87877_1 /TAXON_ID=218684 /ORGANISM="Corethron pennatum, Strain L29A3" /LENGTH=48 /DNA_ID= /DNA_START= /DNA_END= /DNA_ORIENTATION=